jgi:hypothetical protein
MRRPALGRTRRGRSLAVAVLVVSAITLASVPAVAAPHAPRFGPVIEDYAGYVAPDTYPDTAWIGISRACTGTPTSDHQEGRALDWSRDASDKSERAAVADLLEWLFATDRYGNDDAIARRLGISYIIWNRKIWGSWSGEWDVYCVKKPSGCKDPDTHALMNPHTDHVHISFGWPGARMQTTFWNPKDSKAS